MFVAILADLVQSREATDRDVAQDRLRAARDELGRSPVLATALARDEEGPIPPEITTGDEIQVLLAGPPVGEAAVACLREITESMRPASLQVAFGIGFGSLSVRLRRPVRELDGECFHRARTALVDAQRAGGWARVASAWTAIDDVTNALLRMTGDVRRGWTDRQAEVAQVYERSGVQKVVAGELRVSPSVISEILHAARYDSVVQAEAAIATLLDVALDPALFLGDPRSSDSSP